MTTTAEFKRAIHDHFVKSVFRMGHVETVYGRSATNKQYACFVTHGLWYKVRYIMELRNLSYLTGAAVVQVAKSEHTTVKGYEDAIQRFVNAMNSDSEELYEQSKHRDRVESAVQRYVDEHYAQSLRAASAEIENADADSVSTLADSMHSASFVSSQELQEVVSPAVSAVPKSSETPDSVKTESEVAQEPAEPKESEHQARAEEELLPETASIDPSMIHSHAIIDYDAYDMMLSGTLSSNSTSGTTKETPIFDAHSEKNFKNDYCQDYLDNISVPRVEEDSIESQPTAENVPTAVDEERSEHYSMADDMSDRLSEAGSLTSEFEVLAYTESLANQEEEHPTEPAEHKKSN